MNEKIYYNEDLPEGVEPLYNGNIADVYYSAHDSAHFRLSYDGLNRLTASQQYTRDGVKTAAAEAFTYDKMGNITSIVRSTQNPQPDYINRVQLFYDGNRIIRGEGSPYSGGYNDMVYPNLVGKDVEYEYDPNGNLIKNSDNRISLTTYNLLNLPQTVAFSDKSLSVFYYMADGRKIRNATGAYSISTAVPIDSVVKNTDPYISYMSEWNDEYWYQGKQQKYINTPEGNIEVSTGRKMSFSYYYTSKDHLGSIWHYWNSLSNKYSNIYYPSGIMREKRRSPFNYGLTGKEIVYDNGLDEYFFGARTLFAPINRFNQLDPLCEEYYHISPYAYCANNFINALDPTGEVPG
ncbi:RHS repeat-associated core domain-containing protein [Coprobacter fastidiosus]|uniref:RHS repeat-associated core domain-containing protein n=1 Tax=Coprobacter fastidiosus TaxID=1099853 RepID=UPI00266FA32D|nr:RHS repeat-associated core domain-containing protein [Coprobacter fastidiosus]